MNHDHGSGRQTAWELSPPWPESQESWATVLTPAAHGDPAAEELFYRLVTARYLPSLTARLWPLSEPAPEARGAIDEGIVQFLQLIRQGKADLDRNWTMFLYTICYNKVNNILRRHQRSAREVPDIVQVSRSDRGKKRSISDDIPDTSMGPEEPSDRSRSH
jgi:hypothetical protein